MQFKARLFSLLLILFLSYICLSEKEEKTKLITRTKSLSLSNSNDIISLIIQKLAEEEQRIKILNNKKNMATLYSKNIGILNSKWKYIMNLDNDDLFMDFDVFDKINKEAEKGNYDIIGFNAIDWRNYNLYMNIKKDYHYIIISAWISIFSCIERN